MHGKNSRRPGAGGHLCTEGRLYPYPAARRNVFPTDNQGSSFRPKLFAGTKNGDGTTTHGSCALYETSTCTLRPHRGYGA